MKKFENFTEWFDNVLFEADIIDTRYPVKGFGVYKQWGTRIAKKIIEMLENDLEASGHEPMLFPVVISEEDFAKEAQHIEGFTAEVFWITHAGRRRLERKILLRPTSETAMYPMFAQWIRSHADLPLKIFQSVFVYRYETKATRPLFRMREFLWNEAHTAHKDWDEAEAQVREAVNIYRRIFKRLGLSFYILRRPDFDKFAGAVYSIAFDAWNPDGRVNQIGTVHNLGENFAKAFEVTYETPEGTQRYVAQTCYGFGVSRTLAAVIAQHGDDHGLVLPPEVAPIQVIIVPILYKETKNEVLAYAKDVYEVVKGAGIRVQIDEEEKTPGEKYYHWEMFGVPVRIEVGPKDMNDRCVTLSERVTLQRNRVAYEDIVPAIHGLFAKINEDLERRSQSMLESLTVDVENLEELRGVIGKRKIARVSWCERQECADKIKEETGGEVRGYRIDVEETPKSGCIACRRQATKVVYVARAY
ncbi:MAG: proline--tRNA ligase [Nitrososphaerota archaeon]|nr:proline--tRNA ligase [Candidatus Bathyarchaeota archaeon]MDW8049186.1 proline--tRNA ligase [Nitrososphaerota archaeon]